MRNSVPYPILKYEWVLTTSHYQLELFSCRIPYTNVAIKAFIWEHLVGWLVKIFALPAAPIALFRCDLKLDIVSAKECALWTFRTWLCLWSTQLIWLVDVWTRTILTKQNKKQIVDLPHKHKIRNKFKLSKCLQGCRHLYYTYACYLPSQLGSVLHSPAEEPTQHQPAQ